MIFWPEIAYADCVVSKDLLCDPIVQKVIANIVQPVIWVLFALAILYFLWGVIRYITGLAKGGENEIKEGQKHMIWGIVGLAIMLSVYGIMNLIFNTVTDIGGNTGFSNQPIQKPTVIDNGF